MWGPRPGGRGQCGLTVQGEVESGAVQVAMLAHGQGVAHRAVEGGIPVGLVQPQVEGAGERQQARGLADYAAGHVALWEGGRRRSASPGRQPPHLKSS